tara:strand:+ start:1638 stop:1934 length:297 start_codon:yes stop_codon:yes gene_type:complete
MLDEEFAQNYASRKLGRALTDEEKSIVLSLPDRTAVREWAILIRSSTLKVEVTPKIDKKPMLEEVVVKESEEVEQTEQSKPNKGIKKKKYTNTGKSNS